MATTYDRPVTEAEERTGLLSEEYVVKTMPQLAGTLDMTSTFVLIIFFITNVASAVQGGAGTFTFWIIGGVTFFIPCVIATAQLGHMYPHEGSLYNWTHRAFGDYWSFFVGFCAWFPCILLMITAADAVVNYIQGLNPNWLVAPWQQGLALMVLLVISGFIASRRFRTVLNLVNIILVVAFLAVILVGIAGVVWLLKGHPPVASFHTAADWGFSWNPRGYYTLALFAFITQAYLGIEAPLNMGGEMFGRRVVTRHLLWGTLLVFVGYFVATFGVLVVLGTAQSGNPYALAMTVQLALGKAAGALAAVLIMVNFVVTPAVYNYSYARLLLVAGIDQRLPVSIARLNKNRVPANAITFQTCVAIIFTAIVYIAAPALTTFTNPATLNLEVYNVVISASTLVWAISTAFLFINLVKLFIDDPKAFRARLIFPMPVLWISIVLGTITCIVSIAGALLYSLIPQYIDNGHWWVIVGGITIACLIFAAIGGILASSEADWEKMNQ